MHKKISLTLVLLASAYCSSLFSASTEREGKYRIIGAGGGKAGQMIAYGLELQKNVCSITIGLAQPNELSLEELKRVVGDMPKEFEKSLSFGSDPNGKTYMASVISAVDPSQKLPDIIACKLKGEKMTIFAQCDRDGMRHLLQSQSIETVGCASVSFVRSGEEEELFIYQVYPEEPTSLMSLAKDISAFGDGLGVVVNLAALRRYWDKCDDGFKKSQTDAWTVKPSK